MEKLPLKKKSTKKNKIWGPIQNEAVERYHATDDVKIKNECVKLILPALIKISTYWGSKFSIYPDDILSVLFVSIDKVKIEKGRNYHSFFNVVGKNEASCMNKKREKANHISLLPAEDDYIVRNTRENYHPLISVLFKTKQNIETRTKCTNSKLRIKILREILEWPPEDIIKSNVIAHIKQRLGEDRQGLLADFKRFISFKLKNSSEDDPFAS